MTHTRRARTPPRPAQITRTPPPERSDRDFLILLLNTDPARLRGFESRHAPTYYALPRSKRRVIDALLQGSEQRTAPARETMLRVHATGTHHDPHTDHFVIALARLIASPNSSGPRSDLHLTRLLTTSRANVIPHIVTAARLLAHDDVPFNYQTLLHDLTLYGGRTSHAWQDLLKRHHFTPPIHPRSAP